MREMHGNESEFAFGSAGRDRTPRNCQQRDTIRTLSQRFLLSLLGSGGTSCQGGGEF